MANLSNINNKFLFTDGDFLLIGGATANSISATESGIAIKNSNAATLSLQNSATNGKNHTLWSNTDGSFNITDVGVATRFTIASGGDVYFPETLRLGIGTTSIYPQGADAILKIYSASGGSRLYLQSANTGSATTDGSQIYIGTSDLNISNMEGETRFFNEGSIMMDISKFDGSANANPLISSNIRIWTGSKTGWLPGDILSKIEFYSNDVSGEGARNAASIRVINEDGNGSTTTTFSGALAFYTSAYDSFEKEAMRIGSTGTVSVLKTDSSTYSSTTPVADLILSRKNTENTNNETVGIRFDVTGWSGSTTGGAAIEAIQPSNSSSADLAFLTRNAGTWGERMRIDSSGNVGIGIAPVSGARLTLGTGSVANEILSIAPATGGNAELRNTSSTGTFTFTNANGSSELMVITSGGLVGIGTGNSVVGDTRLEVRHDGADLTHLRLRNNGNGDHVRIRFQGNNTSGNAKYADIRFDPDDQILYFTNPYNSAARMSITDDGSLKVPSVHSQTTNIGANVVVLSDGELLRSTSSLKYKTDVRDYDKGLNEVMQLQPKYYKGKNDESETQFAGLIAEDVHDLGLTEFVQYADDGTPDALSYTNMIALLTKSIQELKAEIEQLKTQINN